MRSASTRLSAILPASCLVALIEAEVLCLPISLKATTPESTPSTFLERADVAAAGLVVVALILLAVSPSAAVTLLAMAALALVFALRPPPGLAALASLLPFFLTSRDFGSLAFSLPELALLSALAGSTLRGVYVWRRSVRPLAFRPDTPLDGPAALFLTAALTSLLASEVLRVSLRELRTLVLEPLAAYYLAAWFLRRERDVAVVVTGLLLGGTMAALMGLGQYFFTDHVIAVEGVRRILGPYTSPNNLGLYLGRMLPVAIALALYLPATRAMSVPLVGILTGALLLTFSLGAWIASLLAVLVVLGLWWQEAISVAAGYSPRGPAPNEKRRGLKPAATALAVVGLLALVALAIPLLRLERVWSHFVAGSGTGFIRLQLWQASINMIRDHPLLGVGMDNFFYQYRSGYILPDAIAEPNLSHPHNLVLNFWLETGVMGVASALWLAVALWRLGKSLWQQSLTSLARAVLAGIAGAGVDLVAHGMVDNSYFLVDLAFHFWLTAGIVVALGRQSGIASPLHPARQMG